MRITNYDKYPSTHLSGDKWQGWSAIAKELAAACGSRQTTTLAVDSYTAVHLEPIAAALRTLAPELVISTETLLKQEADIRAFTQADVTNDAIFGYMTRLEIEDFFDPALLADARAKVARTSGLAVVYGPGSSLVAPDGVVVYADMPRWELQMRQRRGEVHGLGVDDSAAAPSAQYKRGFFVDWRVLDRLKKRLLTRVDYWLDTVRPTEPRMIPREVMLRGLELTAQRPFRVVPFFDPGPWGGQWMKQVCDLPLDKPNYAWCFDCVPEENSLLLDVDGVSFEMPSVNLVFNKAKELLGERVWSRFGDEFPIRFDFLDTMGGGNLSLQVHPTTQYIRDQFGMDYTQEESYYILDADPGAHVYLGVQNSEQSGEIIAALNRAQQGDEPFDADRYINRFEVRKHDHILIPPGTIHCSGTGSMVLEISATPYIFTFKLWDWGRLGLDGKPRPINIAHGSKVIDWRRDTEFCERELVNNFEPIASGEGWSEIRTGLHTNEFIETRRHEFTVPVEHDTVRTGVNVLNLVEGSAAVVSSPTGAFEPYTVHYAETFIIPAAVGRYTISPATQDEQCATLKAFVRTNA